MQTKEANPQVYQHPKSIPEALITFVRAPDDGCQHPKHVELPTEM